jgi:hypothetical protein
MRKIVLDKELLYQKYIIENKTILEVSKDFDVCISVIIKNLRDYEIKSKSNKIKELDKYILEDMYLIQLLSIRDIAKKLNVPTTQIRKSLKFHKITRRNKS